MEKARPFANKNIFMYCICFEVFDQYAPETENENARAFDQFATICYTTVECLVG